MTKSNKNVSTIISGVLAVIMLIVCAVLLVACGPKKRYDWSIILSRTR